MTSLIELIFEDIDDEISSLTLRILQVEADGYVIIIKAAFKPPFRFREFLIDRFAELRGKSKRTKGR